MEGIDGMWKEIADTFEELKADVEKFRVNSGGSDRVFMLGMAYSD